MSVASLSSVHHRFEAALPTMDRTFRFLLRHVPQRRRDEALADARAAAWHAWHGLLRRGKDPESVGVTGIAANAARYTLNGRRLGTGTPGRGAMDVFHPRARRELGLRVVSFEEAHRETAGAWRQWLVEDNRATPAEQAIFRIDLEAWLATLPVKHRRIAELLSQGNEGIIVAQALGVTPGRISQVRAELASSWAGFQAEPACL